MAIINGYVDGSTLAPIIRVKLISGKNEEIELPAIIDTGYNGEVILSESKIQEMGLEFLGTIDTELADGGIVELDLFRGRIKWFDRIQEIAIGTTQSQDASVGTLLLADCKLDVNFKERWVSVEQLV
jgi:clan AA aspartic protease